ncbi:MAG: hypothetical protein DHS20C18_44200 [Saprospiraceae bacterium]|nr:MAG: hypothetical protein DHS20C18_44200 [Saprospiraceae bacterium]
MKKVYLLLTCLLLSTISIFGQRLENFSENQGEFLNQLKDYMTSSKQQKLEDAFKEFETAMKGGLFSAEETDQIISTANGMLTQRMGANPYFFNYLLGLVLVKKTGAGADKEFLDWHVVLIGMLADMENRRVKPYNDFLSFSVDFFEHDALRYATGAGTSWLVRGNEHHLKYEDKIPFVSFDKLNLIASRYDDSIQILETKGNFYPVEKIWRGEGGRVTWERVGLDAGVYAELGEYEFEVKMSLYEVPNARLHYPLFFGGQAIEGNFIDKLSSSGETNQGSYPRFESKQKILKVDNIGRGIKYSGGFRLHGTTIYGYGDKENKAELDIFNSREKMVFHGASELFTIRREERIGGEGVDAVLYYGKDSIYHPSVNFRFNIPERELQLSRGKRGNDRNPFFDSYHNINIDAENINLYLEQDSIVFGKPTVSIAKKGDVVFESLEFFRKAEYERIQNIATANPIAIMKATAEHEGTNFINANLLAERINSKFTVANIESLLYDLVSKGFINYDSDEQLIEIKYKVKHYVESDQGTSDYDNLRIISNTNEINGTMSLRNQELRIDGMTKMGFSDKQKVALVPTGDMIVMKKDRNIDFDGRLFAGLSVLEGKDFHFDYGKFQVDMDSVRFFDLFVPTGEFDKAQNPIALSIASRIEHFKGVLLIDAPHNKSGKEDIPMFPSLQTKSSSFVYYYRDSTQEKAYPRDSFYFELKPFSFNHLDLFSAEDLHFKGKLFSADIFPVFDETLVLRDDESLGFLSETPQNGYPVYKDKGKYKGQIDLSNKGLLGLGSLKYLGASIDSEDIIFKPDQLIGSADKFNLDENRQSAVEVPRVRGVDVRIDWRPYKDSMYVSSEEAPFQLFQEGDHELEGTLILTPTGLKANGTLNWEKASMRSKLFSFGAFSAEADTMDLKINSFDAEDLALRTTNVNGKVDFDEKLGTFKANDEYLVTELPYNQYITSMNEFNWDMPKETIFFEADENKPGVFTSIHPDQDSLTFEGNSAVYDIRSSLLKISDVPYVQTCDAYIYPDSNYLEIQKGGLMGQLQNAKIIADTANQYHVINRASVNIMGKKQYKASGFYEYNIGDKEQEIELQDIIGERVGKGQMNEKRTETRAIGTIEESNHFYIDHKTEFQGKIKLNAQSKNLQFEGFARLEAENLPSKYWFTVSSEGDKKDLAIAFDEPKSFDGEPLETGLFLGKESAQIYPRVMMPLMFRKDRPIIPVKGVFKYDKEKDQFIFGDSSKIFLNGLRGNLFTFKNRDGSVEAEGRFNIGSGLKYVKVDAAGFAKSKFPPPAPPEDIILLDDTTATTTKDVFEYKLDAELMAGIQLSVPEALLKIMVNDFQASSFDARNITYLTDLNYYRKVTSELFPIDKEMKEVINGLGSGFLDIPKKYNPYTFLFSRLNLKWDSEYQSFVTKEKSNGLVSIDGVSMNKIVEALVEFKMPSNDDDRLYIYLKSPSGLYYFFGYKQGILNLVSNNPEFMDAFHSLKAKDLVQKMDDGETYEIQEVEPGDAKRFERRAEAAMKN